MDAERLARATGFIAEFSRRQAERVVGVPGGFAVLSPAYAASYLHNKLILTDPADGGAAVTAADAVLGGAGLPHRMVDALRGIDPGPLRAAGYEPATNVVMCHSGPPDRPADPAVRVEVVDLDTMVDKGRREWRAELTGAGDRAVEQLARRRESLLRGAPEVIFLGVREAGAVVAHADLYADPESGVAQLEDVQTDAAYRDRGLARALLADGLRRARSAGCDLVFLVAGADDWPRHLYARLGYADVGEIHEFTRAPTSLDGTGQLP